MNLVNMDQVNLKMAHLRIITVVEQVTNLLNAVRPTSARLGVKNEQELDNCLLWHNFENMESSKLIDFLEQKLVDGTESNFESCFTVIGFAKIVESKMQPKARHAMVWPTYLWKSNFWSIILLLSQK